MFGLPRFGIHAMRGAAVFRLAAGECSAPAQRRHTASTVVRQQA